MTSYENAIAEAAAAFAAAVAGGDIAAVLRPLTRAVELRGGMVGDKVKPDVVKSVCEEVLDLFMVEFSSTLGPRIDKRFPEAGTMVDEELAQIRADLAAMLAKAFPLR